jgi:PAS domain S-box-containing protein
LQSGLFWTTESDLYRFQIRNATKYAMFAMDTTGRVLTWNAGVLHLLGYTEEEWLGQHASVIFLPKDQAHEVCMSEVALAAEKGSSTDIRWHVRKDGSELFAHGFMTPIRDDAGKLLGFSKILSDETRSKELQDSLTESNMALEQFAYVASHDLQEPLRTIGALTELLAARYKDKLDGKAEQIFRHIIEGASRMSDLIHDLLTLARVTTEVDRPASCALDQDIETAISQLQALIDETHAVVTHDALPSIPADQGQMVRLFQNLIGNALRYRKPDIAPAIHVSALGQGDEWLFTVKDNGIGFDPEFAAMIFLPFKRLHSQADLPGTGVGLAICRRIVESHGGRIWAESQPGEGASFHFTLPAKGKLPQKYTAPVTRGL